MATGQGSTRVLVADARQAWMFDVEDAGLPPRLRTTLPAPPAEARPPPPQHGWTNRADPHPEHEERRLVHALVHMLEQDENQFRHLVLVAPPKLLGMLRESLSRGLADRLRSSIAKDWGHLTGAEMAEHVRPLVQIWPR